MFAKNPAAAAKLQSPSALTALHKVRYACRGRLISRFVPRQKIKKVRADLANYTSSKTDRSLDQFVPRRVKKPRESAACILNRTFHSQVAIFMLKIAKVGLGNAGSFLIRHCNRFRLKERFLRQLLC